MKNARNILLLCLAFMMCWGIYAKTKEASINHLKAKYYYLEGSVCAAQDNNAEAFELFRKAYKTDPDYAEAANALGSYLLAMELDSAKQYEEALQLMRPAVDSFPDDFFESRFYAYVASQIDKPEESIRVYERLHDRFPDKTSILLNLAEAYVNNNDREKALDTYSRYEKTEGKNPQISLRKMTIMLQHGDTARAIREADDLIASNPQATSYKVLKGNLFLYIGQNDSAMHLYTEAEKNDPESGETKIALANYYRQQGDSVAYDTKIYESLLCDDYDLEQKIQILGEYLSTLLRDKSSTKRGDDLFKTLREQYPHEPDLLSLAANYSAAKGDWKDAAEQVGYAVDLQPENENNWNRLMSFQIAADKYTDAINSYRRAEEHINPSENLKYLLASAYMLDKQYANSIDIFGKLIHEIVPDVSLTDTVNDRTARGRLSYEDLLKVSSLYNSIGDAYFQATDTIQAFTAYENSLFFFSENPLTLNNYAYFLAESGRDLQRAETMSAKAVKIDPDNPTYLDTYAWIFFKEGNYTMAKLYQSSAIEHSQDNLTFELLEHYGDILFMNGEPDAALENWEKALELAPDREILQRKVKHKTFFYK